MLRYAASVPGGERMASSALLVVDDNPANLKLVEYLLMKTGYDVQTAVDAVSAMERIRERPPELILMDLQLPGMDGLELTRRLKSAPDTRDIVIVAVTAYAMSGDEERALEAGCDGYLTKPVDTRTLPDVVSSYLRESKAG